MLASRWMFGRAVVCVGLIVSQLITSGRLCLLKNVVPPLARALAPLRPSEAEIKQVLQELKGHKLKPGSKLQASDVTAGIEQLKNAV